MIPAWTVSIVAFLALTGKYYGYDLPEVARHHARARKTRSLDFWKSKRITEKEWMLVLKFLGIPRTVERFGFAQIQTMRKSLGYIVFVILALIFLVVSFLVPYLYGLLFSLLSGVMFFVSVRLVIGPKRTWKLTVRTHDSDRYLVPSKELRKNEFG